MQFRYRKIFYDEAELGIVPDNMGGDIKGRSILSSHLIKRHGPQLLFQSVPLAFDVDLFIWRSLVPPLELTPFPQRTTP
jgi:hypothetical protein